jgi:hypothetical protein
LVATDPAVVAEPVLAYANPIVQRLIARITVLAAVTRLIVCSLPFMVALLLVTARCGRLAVLHPQAATRRLREG